VIMYCIFGLDYRLSGIDLSDDVREFVPSNIIWIEMLIVNAVFDFF